MSHDSHGHAGKIDPHDLGHIVPFKIFLNVFIALLVLTVVTVAVSRVDFGHWNMVVAMFVASIKALLVMCFFMHLKYENPIVVLYVVFPIVLVAVMLGGVFVDNPFRKTTWPEAGNIFVVGTDKPQKGDLSDAHGHGGDHGPAKGD